MASAMGKAAGPGGSTGDGTGMGAGAKGDADGPEAAEGKVDIIMLDKINKTPILVSY